MFKKAQIKLTILYSALCLLLFWTFSFGIYSWMNNSFGEGYISQVKLKGGIDPEMSNVRNSNVVTTAGDVTLSELLKILIILNSGLLFIIPIASWLLAKQTLAPIKSMHEIQNQFVSDASHEMRTPLSIIKGEIEVTLQKKRKSSDYKNTLKSTSEEVDRLAKLIENLLFLARDNNQTQMSTFEIIDVTDVVSEVKQALLPKSKKKLIKLTLITKNISNTPIVHGNTLLLRQLFYNLLDNAITYTPKKGRITLSLAEIKNTICIKVQDTGVGIPLSEHQKIFNRFYRIDPSRSQVKGYGLGLSIAKTIVARHNGQLLISSVLKKGTIFKVILPKA